ncbi:MAG: glycosyltransferase family 4 protein, partial [Candidatus Latescibacteria bacterium]|nr:glycosyltransferase family 4 protein [Candidatus Latescibacterota bacterium]
MRVALVVHDVSKQRGHDRYVAELASELADRHEVHVFACTCEGVDQTKVRFHRVPAFRWPDLLKMLSFIVTATWALRKQRFDIIHTQGVCSLIQNVTTAHFCQAAWLAVYQGLDHPDVSRSRQWYHRGVMRIMMALERFVYHPGRSRHIIALSEQVKRDLVGWYGRPAETITAVHNGLNLEEFHPANVARYRSATRAQLGIPGDTFVLLFVGEFQRKGLRYAIQALVHLPGRGRVLLVVAGDGEARPYREEAKRLSVAGAVRFVGQRADINRYYAMSDAVVFPTLYEPFGFTITEGMATGVPVVTSAGAGAAEVIRDGMDGLLVHNPRDAREIAGHIHRLMADPELRARLGQQGRTRVEGLSWQAFAERVERIYR